MWGQMIVVTTTLQGVGLCPHRASGGIRTPASVVRSHELCPLSYTRMELPPGIEPGTRCLQDSRSANLSYGSEEEGRGVEPRGPLIGTHSGSNRAASPIADLPGAGVMLPRPAGPLLFTSRGLFIPRKEVYDQSRIPNGTEVP